MSGEGGAASPRRGHLLALGALGVVYVVWGSTYLAIRIADRSLPPFLMAGIRYLIAAALLGPFVLGRRSRADTGEAPRRAWAALFGCAPVGILMLAGGNGGVSWAERAIPSGLAALLVATVPLWMVLVDRAFTSRVPSPATLAALAVGFAGVALLAVPGSRAGHLGAVLAVLLASVLWSIGSLLGHHIPQPARPLEATTYQMLFGGLALLVLAALTGEFRGFHPGAVSAESWLALAYLVGPGSILALSCYTTALRRLPTSLVATYAYVNPVIAVLLGWALLSEHLSTLVLAGGALVVGSVALVVGAQRASTRRLAAKGQPTVLPAESSAKSSPGGPN